MPRFDEIPLIDNHLHPPLWQSEVEGRAFTTFFTETHNPAMLDNHVPHTRSYRRALRDLAALLDCVPEQDAVVAARAARGPAGMLRLCVERGNVAALIVDDGYPPPGHGMTPADMAEASGRPAPRVLRLETLVSVLASVRDDLDGFEEALLRALDQARAAGTVAIKSIVAYRGGLRVYLPERDEAQEGLSEVHERCLQGWTRVADLRLLYHTLALTLEWAGDVGVPVQLHTGFGDRDLDLTRVNPALLKPLLEDPRFNRGPLVLLHAGYPYAREAGYLAAMYPQVYVDWSLANPLLAGPELTRVLQELLALAPTTKLLYGSDAWGIPDWIWLGARYGRAALAEALADDPDAEADAHRILHDNAAELYGLTNQLVAQCEKAAVQQGDGA